MHDNDLDSLAEKASRGNQKALEVLCETPDLSRIFQDAYNSAYSQFRDSYRLINVGDEEDVRQEFLAIIVGKIASYRGEAKFSTWAWRVAFNTTIKYFVKKQSILIISSDKPLVLRMKALEGDEEKVREQTREMEQRDLLVAAIRQVDIRYRKVLLLRLQENSLTFEAIANRLGISRASAHRYLQKGMLELQHIIRKLLTEVGDQ